MFYAQAFRGYAENRLVRELGTGGLKLFRTRAQALGGTPIEIGDAGYAFAALPHVHLAAVYWLGKFLVARRWNLPSVVRAALLDHLRPRRSHS